MAEAKLDHRAKPFNFFWRLVLIPGVLNRTEPQAGAIEQSVAVEPLMSVLRPRQKPTIVEYFGNERTHVWVEAPSFVQEQPLTGTDRCLPVLWYRSNWVDANGVNDCKSSFIVQSRFDRYEVYSSLMRLWTTAVDTEQAIFSFQTNTDQTGKSWTPNYSFIGGRLLLAAGACDDYDNETSGILWSPTGIPSGYFSGGILSPTPTLSTGSCNNNPIRNTGANALTHQDIYGFTHDVANDMQSASGTTLFLNDTGHSIHDERPIFFANQILHFLTGHDNNINITLLTGGTT
jgi:hypothetical protein